MKKNNGLFWFILLFVLLLGVNIVCSYVFMAIKPASIFYHGYDENATSVFADENCINEKNTDFGFCDNFQQLVLNKRNNTIDKKVYLGGKTIGMSFDDEGAIVIGINEFLSTRGLISPAADSNLRIGDVITEIDGKKITNSSALANVLQDIGNKEVKIVIKHGQIVEERTIKPDFDMISKTFKLGLWVKDAGSGIGTLTFIEDDGYFGSLGHPVVDSQSGKILKVDSGSVYTCNILSIEKGISGKAGELRGIINNNNKIGDVITNNRYGVYGKIDKGNYGGNNEKMIQVAAANEVKPGKAKIICSLDSDIPKEYDIEIVKAAVQTKVQDKGMVIRVTDKNLLELTGGIVQGMSGSPIVQNGKLVGAVTHVFVSDPTRGYGIYAEWMLETAEKIK